MPETTNATKTAPLASSERPRHAPRLVELRFALAKAAVNPAIWGIPGLPQAIKGLGSVLDEVQELRERVAALEAGPR